MFNNSQHGLIRKDKTPFRDKDYLLTNMKKFIILPANIIFVSHQKIIELSQNSENVVFDTYMGMEYTLNSFMNKHQINEPEIKNLFKTKFYENFTKIQFKNIPEEVKTYFRENNVTTIHIRRGDKVVNDNGEANGISENDIDKLNMLTELGIHKINENHNICFVSDEREKKKDYYDRFNNKFSCMIFDYDDISQTYIDMFCLINSNSIIMSQAFSTFSIFASMFNKTPLFYLLEHSKINEFAKSHEHIEMLEL
jgi:hypothetical protein